MIRETKMIVETKKGTLIKVPVTLEYTDSRIKFVKAPFALKDEIKSMKGRRWHGYDDPPQKIWTVDNCHRNAFQIEYLEGGNPYAWFERPLQQFEYTRPLYDHQKDLANSGLTYHYQIWAAEVGVGKTLSAQEVMEKSGVREWFWVGPKSSLPNMEREFAKWDMDPRVGVELMTFNALVKWATAWSPGMAVPKGIIFDEAHNLKHPSSDRTRAAQFVADLIRTEYDKEGFVILMTGTPASHSPTNWWSLAEITWPGFLKEGSVKALEQRLSFMKEMTFDSGTFMKRTSWRDDPAKCDICGEYDFEHEYDSDHKFIPSRDEVSFMFERLEGLVKIKHKKDCLDLPDMQYRTLHCEPSPSILRVLAAIEKTADNAMTAMALARELSDGFQYREVEDGVKPCTHCEDGKVDEWFGGDKTYSNVDMLRPEVVETLEKRTITCPNCKGELVVKNFKRVTKQVPCPKDKLMKQLLEENESQGRIVVFAGFQGSIDRVEDLCRKDGWNTVRLDGRGYKVTAADGTRIHNVKPLDYWADLSIPRVAFIAHPESGGVSLTLTESRTAVGYSNSFKPEARTQAMGRIHRPGMDHNKGATWVDLVHLPTDQRTIDILSENRRLEKMTMGEVFGGICD